MNNVSKIILKKLFNAHTETLKALRLLRKELNITFEMKTYKACNDMIRAIDNSLNEVTEILQDAE